MTQASSSVLRPLAHRVGLELAPQRRVFASFFLYAFGLGGIYSRLPELQRTLGAGEGALGLALIGTAMGTLVSLFFAAKLVERFGHRRTLLALLPLVPVWFAVASHMPGPLWLFLCLIPAGLCVGAVEVVVNLEADRVEHQLGRRIMNRGHAFWSFGFFAAGLFGASMAKLGIDPRWHLALIVPLTLLATLALLGRFEAAPRRTGDNAEHTPHFARPTWAIVALVALTLSAMVLEGAGFDWSGIYMRDVHGSTAFVSGLAVATGAAAQALARYLADGLVDRYKPVAVARTLLCLLGLGNLLVFAAPGPLASLFGFALMGVGTSALFPLAMSAAAQRTDRPAAVNVAALAQFAFVAFLLAPPLLGLVAERWGVRWSFGIALPLVLLSLAASHALAAQPGKAHEGG